jgi:3-phytase
MNTIYNKIAIPALLALSIAGCNSQVNNGQHLSEANFINSSQPKKVFKNNKLNGHKSYKLNEDLFVGNSENLGLFLYSKNGSLVYASGGNYEGLDFRKIGNDTHLISINKETGETELFAISGKTLTKVRSLTLDKSGVNNVCFYQPNEQELQVILLTKDHRLEQRLVINDEGQKANFSLIRDLPAPPHSAACAVNDKQNTLFVAEELNGVWAYPLNPEDELQRELVSVSKPHGALEGEIKDLSITGQGQLIVSLPDMQQVLLLQKDEASWQHFWIKTSDNSTPESASLYSNQDLVWFDKESDSYQMMTVDVPTPSQRPTQQEIKTVKATSQTTPVNNFGDAADDPAIWPNITSPEESLILGTDKSAGLYVYNMKGETIKFLDSGRVNNVDISFGFDYLGQQIDLAAASNRTKNAITLYSISKTGDVVELADIQTGLPDVYGLCSYKSPINNKHYVFINDESGKFEQYHISTHEQKIEGQLVREFSVPTQPEGCVADATSQTLYLGEEGEGIWRTSAEPGNSQLELVIKIDNKVLFDDVEGLSIYHGNNKDYLVASSQGNNSYVLYDLADLSLAGNFRVNANFQAKVDGTSETDGLAVSSFNFGGAFSKGLLVVQDGRNVMPNQPQNFKLISWSDIQSSLSLAN